VGDIAVVKRFADNGSYQREKEDLSYTLFENLDFTEAKRHISFFRSDFRGSKFVKVKFYRNNFDRADFISCYVKECEFNSVKFGGCEIKNCYFEDIVFKDSLYEDSSIQQSTFVRCTFPSEKFLVSMFNCTFIDCLFSDCSFEMSTTENLKFEKCTIVNTDLATMHAEAHVFDSCTLENVCIDICYIWGYLIHDTSIADVDFLYRGERINLKDMNDTVLKLLQEQRYFEFINANIILKNPIKVSALIGSTIDRLLKGDALFIAAEMNNILTAILFYINKSMIPFEEVFSIMEILEDIDWDIFGFENKLNYIAKLEVIKRILNNGEYSYDFLGEIPVEHESIVVFECHTVDLEDAENATTDFLHELSQKMNIGDAFRLVDKQAGSWILTFIIPTICALMIPKIIKAYFNTYIELTFKSKLSKKLAEVLTAKNLKISDLQKLSETASIANIVGTGNNSDFSDTTKALLDVAKVIKIGV